jgi:heat shock protein HslJ
MQGLHLAAIISTATICATGCSASVTHATETNSILGEPAKWELIELLGKPVDAQAGMVPWVQFEKKENKLHGFSGCNRFSGTFETRQGNQIRFSRMATTQMACPGMSMEAEFQKVLGVADSFSVSGEDLVLNRARMAPLARFRAKIYRPE